MNRLAAGDMKVLALASYPIEAAATRYRLSQFVEPLAQRGIDLQIHPFMDSRMFARLYQKGSTARTAAGLMAAAVVRLKEILNASRADVVLIQREVMVFGPPLIEWIIARLIRSPVVLDLDDATYIAYTSPTYGALGALKWFGKTDSLITWANLVTCGNRAIAEYASSKGARSIVIPTVVDTEVFRPRDKDHDRDHVTLGWIGTHSTYPYLESIFPVLTELGKRHQIRLKIVGAGKKEIQVPNVELENLEWKLVREVEDFQSIDIGLYPIDTSRYSGGWALGKSGFKAIQYMAVGVPYVATPVGGSCEIGVAGTTHIFAASRAEWISALESLISDEPKR